MNSDSPFLSIVTVVYNNCDLLEKTILSIAQQSYSSIEYIIIDGKSTDSTIEIIKKHESMISFWTSEKDNGIYDAMNKGIKTAKGEWIYFLNAGDVFAAVHTLENVVAALKKNINSDVVYGDILYNKSDMLILRQAKDPCNIHKMYFCHQSAFIKRSLMTNYLYDTKYKMSADLKFFKQIYLAGHKLVHIPMPVVVYDRFGISNTKRNKGLYENVEIVKEIDKGYIKLLFLIRLYFTIYWRILNRKK